MKTEFFIEDVFQIPDKGCVVVGTVKSGTVYKGMATNINGKQAIVEEIMIFHKTLQMAKTGDYCGLLLKGIEESDISSPMTIYFE